MVSAVARPSSHFEWVVNAVWQWADGDWIVGAGQGVGGVG
jgi:hypothetical protein